MEEAVSNQKLADTGRQAREQAGKDQLEGSRADRSSPLRLSLLFLGTAALGGIAISVWNRRLLSKLRQVPEQYSLFSEEEDGIDI